MLKYFPLNELTVITGGQTPETSVSRTNLSCQFNKAYLNLYTICSLHIEKNKNRFQLYIYIIQFKVLFQINLIFLSLAKRRDRGATDYQKKCNSNYNVIKLHSSSHNYLFMAMCIKIKSIGLFG